MDVIMRKLEEIQPYDNNPRKNDKAVPYVAESIKRYGFKVPIVIDKSGVIVAGHTRYLASIELGLDEVPCIVADDLTEEQVKEFRLVDNKTAEYSTWDFEPLYDELADLDFGSFDFGFPEDVTDIGNFGESEKEPVKIYRVIVECSNEEEAKELIDKLTEEGYEAVLNG